MKSFQVLCNRTSIQRNDGGQENGNHSVRIYKGNSTIVFPVPIGHDPSSIGEAENMVEGNDFENPPAARNANDIVNFPEDL